MEKIRILVLIFLSVLFQSCASSSVAPSNSKNSSQFDILKLGGSESDVRKLVGNPSEVREGKDGRIWIYNNNDEYRSQRAAITFDIKTVVIDSVTIVPFINDTDSKLDFLQKQKFPASDYVAAPLGRCHRDYFPSITYYVSPSKGIIIEFDRQFNSVRSYSWTSIRYASDLIQKIKNCER